MASTTLKSRFDQIDQELSEVQLLRAVLDRFVTDGARSSALVTRSMQRAAGLIADFKQLAVDQASEERREFELRTVVADCVAALRVPAELSGLQLGERASRPKTCSMALAAIATFKCLAGSTSSHLTAKSSGDRN